MTLQELIGAKRSGQVAYTRAGTGLYRGKVLVYEHNTESPTGVHLLGAIDDDAQVSAVLQGDLSPLSPTEPR